MAVTGAAVGYGITFTYSGISGEIVSVSGPNITRDMIDATHTGSPDGYKEFVGGMRDGGEITLELNMTSATSSPSTLMDQTAPAEFSIAFPSPISKTVSGTALLQSWSPNGSATDKCTVSIGLKVSGKPTIA